MVRRLQGMESEPAQRRPSGRVPPHNLEAEESLLRAMLMGRGAGRPYPRAPSQRDRRRGKRVGRGNPGYTPTKPQVSPGTPGYRRVRGLSPSKSGPA